MVGPGCAGLPLTLACPGLSLTTACPGLPLTPACAFRSTHCAFPSRGNKELLMSDTVGFIQKLPTELVAAFRCVTLAPISTRKVLLPWHQSQGAGNMFVALSHDPRHRHPHPPFCAPSPPLPQGNTGGDPGRPGAVAHSGHQPPSRPGPGRGGDAGAGGARGGQQHSDDHGMEQGGPLSRPSRGVCGGGEGGLCDDECSRLEN